MSILVDKGSRVIIQGITGAAGRFHGERMLEYGTDIVAGVTPGKGGSICMGVPIFDTSSEAVKATDANVSVIFVPAPFAADAIMEAADAHISLVVCITEGIPTLDCSRARTRLKNLKSRLIGPNCPGVITPGECKLGIMPGEIHLPGPIGVVSRSGTLTYEAVWQLTQLGIGQSTCVGIGGDAVVGTSFTDILELFERDEQTEAVVMIGEIGGDAEDRAADFLRDHMTKPVVAYISGRTAPPGKRMGHAGAITSGASGTAEDKMKALKAGGAHVVESPTEIGHMVRELGL